MKLQKLFIVFLVGGLISCVGATKNSPAPSVAKGRTFSFIDETGLKRFLEKELEAPMGSLTSTECVKKFNWTCNTVLPGGELLSLTSDESVQLLAKHIFAKRSDLFVSLNHFQFAFLGCLEKIGRVHCRIEGLVDLSFAN